MAYYYRPPVAAHNPQEFNVSESWQRPPLYHGSGQYTSGASTRAYTYQPNHYNGSGQYISRASIRPYTYQPEQSATPYYVSEPWQPPPQDSGPSGASSRTYTYQPEQSATPYYVSEPWQPPPQDNGPSGASTRTYSYQPEQYQPSATPEPWQIPPQGNGPGQYTSGASTRPQTYLPDQNPQQFASPYVYSTSPILDPTQFRRQSYPRPPRSYSELAPSTPPPPPYPPTSQDSGRRHRSYGISEHPPRPPTLPTTPPRSHSPTGRHTGPGHSSSFASTRAQRNSRRFAPPNGSSPHVTFSTTPEYYSPTTQSNGSGQFHYPSHPLASNIARHQPRFPRPYTAAPPQPSSRQSVGQNDHTMPSPQQPSFDPLTSLPPLDNSQPFARPIGSPPSSFLPPPPPQISYSPNSYVDLMQSHSTLSHPPRRNSPQFEGPNESTPPQPQLSVTNHTASPEQLLSPPNGSSLPATFLTTPRRQPYSPAGRHADRGQSHSPSHPLSSTTAHSPQQQSLHPGGSSPSLSPPQPYSPTVQHAGPGQFHSPSASTTVPAHPPQQDSLQFLGSVLMTAPPQPHPPTIGPNKMSPVEEPPFFQPRSSIQILRQELYAAQRRLLQKSNLVSSLCTELDTIRSVVCHSCKAKISPENLAGQMPFISQIPVLASAESRTTESHWGPTSTPNPNTPISSPDDHNFRVQPPSVTPAAPSLSPAIYHVSTPSELTEVELVERTPLIFQPLPSHVSPFALQTPIVAAVESHNDSCLATAIVISPHTGAGVSVTPPFSSSEGHDALPQINLPMTQQRSARPASPIIPHSPGISVPSETTETFSTPPETPVVEKLVINRPVNGNPKWPVIYNDKIAQALDITFVHAFKHTSAVYDVRFSPDGNFLAAGLYYDLGRAQIYDLNTMSMRCALTEYSGSYREKSNSCGILCVCFSPNGRYLVVGGTFKTIYIWNIARKRVLAAFKGHTDCVWSLDVSCNGRLLVSGSRDGSIRVWKMHDGSSRFLTTQSSNLASVRFNPSGRYVAASNINGFLRIWDVYSGKLVGRWEGHRGVVQSLAFSPDGEELVSSSWDGTTKSWDVSSIKAQTRSGERKGRDSMLVLKDEKAEFDRHSGVVRSLAISPDGKWAITGSSDKRVCILDMCTGVQQCTLEGHANEVMAVDFNPVRNCIAVGSLDGFVTLWRYGIVQDPSK